MKMNSKDLNLDDYESKIDEILVIKKRVNLSTQNETKKNQLQLIKQKI